MIIGKKRFERFSKFPLSDSVVFSASLTIQDEALMMHFLEGDRLSEKEITNVLAKHCRTPNNVATLKRAFDLVKEVKFGGKAEEFQEFVQREAAIFVDEALDALDPINIGFLIEDLGLDVNKIRSINGDNILHKASMKENSKEGKEVFDLLLSQCDQDTITGENKNYLTPIHVAVIHKFNHAIKKLESKIDTDQMKGVVCGPNFFTYDLFKVQIPKRNAEEPNPRREKPLIAKAIAKSYHAVKMSKADDADLPEKVAEAISLLKPLISSSTSLKQTHKLQTEIEKLTTDYRAQLEQFAREPAKAKSAGGRRKGKKKSSPPKAPHNPADKIKAKEAEIKKLDSGIDIETKIITLLIRFYSIFDDIDHELVSFFETELTQCGMFERLVLVYHNAFITLQAKATILQESADAEDNTGVIDDALEKAIGYLQKAKEIIAKYESTGKISKLIISDNYHYFATTEYDEAQKLELLKKAHENNPKSTDIVVDLCSHVVKGKNEPEKQKVQKYLLNCFNALYDNGKLTKENLDKIISIAAALDKEFADSPAFKVFYPLMKFAQFQIAEKAGSMENSKKIIMHLKEHLPAEIAKAESTEHTEVAALYRFLFETMLNVKICNLVSTGEYEKAKIYVDGQFKSEVQQLDFC